MSSSRIVAALLAVGVVAFGATRVLGASTSPTYHTALVRRADVTDTVSITGAVKAATETRLGFKIPGRLAATLVSVGDQVTSGEALARLDTGDLQIALASAQASLGAAQAKYDLVVAGASPEDVAVARQSVDNAQRTLDATRRSTATDLAAAQLSFSTLRSAYSSAETGFQLLGGALPTDSGTFTSSLGAARVDLATALVDFTTMSTADITAAKTAIGQADAQLVNAQSAATQLQSAVTQWQSARDGVISAWQQFDTAVAKGTDTSGAVTQYRSAQLTYATATTQVQTSLTLAAADVTASQQAAAAAQSALNSSTSRNDASLDQVRTDLATFQAVGASEAQLSGAIAGKLGQMTADLTIVSGAVGGSYVSARQAVQSAQDKGATAVVGAQNALDAADTILAKTGAPARSFDVAGAYSGVRAAQAAVDKAQSDLSNAALTSPSAGVVAEIDAQPGEYLAGAAAPVPFIVLYDTSTVTLHGAVGEADVARLKLGQAATVTIDALGATKLGGRVTTIDPVATSQQGVPVYGVDVTIDNADARIRAGMAGTVTIAVASAKGVLVVPSYAIRDDQGRRSVAVLRDGKVVEVPVRLGISDDTFTEVTGVEAGDAVLVPLIANGTTAPGAPAR